MGKIAMGAGALAAMMLLHSSPGVADEQACRGFNWALDTEIGWMSAPDAEAMPSGGTLATPPAKAIALALKPSGSEALPVISGVKKQAVGADSFSGWIKIGRLEKAGAYHVSLSREGWIDVAQDGKLVDSTGFTGKPECTILRKSVSYELGPGETLIQIVGAPSDVIKVTIKPAN
ncbi:MAG TPA: hypothetical protein PKD49_08460 [Hyphomicrobium sp.]|nr:hypothetical protein [Hyphomicrobium sp.]